MVTDEEVAAQLRTSNDEFRELEESHHRLDAELEMLLRNHVLTPQEEVLKKQLQKEKLGKKDRMAWIVRQYRNDLCDMAIS
ncbi:MAG: YdcH family protein [Nitrospirales bacterium]